MFCCQTCKYESNRKFNLCIHIKNKHKREANDIELVRKNEFTKNEQMSLENTQMSLENTQMSLCFEEKKLFCKNCKKVFKTLHGLKHHEIICKGVENMLQCHYCHKSLATRQSKSQHIKVCKIKSAQEQVKDMLDKQSQNVQPMNNITNNTNNQNTNNQIIYQINNYRISSDNYKNKFASNDDNEDIEHINDFGKEDISYISDDQLRQFALDHNFNHFIIEKHFNHNHPENHNIRNNCNKSFKVLRNKRWLPEPKDVVFSVIYNNTRSQMFDFAYNNIFPHLNEEKKEEYLTIMQQYDKYFKRNAYKTIDLQVQELMKDKRLKQLSNTSISPSICI